ncbi:MAG: hypothetical protein ABSA77_06760 [Thermoguttaceae bacterium]
MSREYREISENKFKAAGIQIPRLPVQLSRRSTSTVVDSRRQCMGLTSGSGVFSPFSRVISVRVLGQRDRGWQCGRLESQYRSRAFQPRSAGGWRRRPAGLGVASGGTGITPLLPLSTGQARQTANQPAND